MIKLRDILSSTLKDKSKLDNSELRCYNPKCEKPIESCNGQIVYDVNNRKIFCRYECANTKGKIMYITKEIAKNFAKIGLLEKAAV